MACGVTQGNVADAEVSEFLTYFKASVRQFYTATYARAHREDRQLASLFPQEFGWIHGQRSQRWNGGRCNAKQRHG